MAPTEPRVAEPSDVHVYEPHTVDLPHVGNYFREVWERRAFLRTMARADITGQHAGMAAGQLWSLLDPILQAFTYWILIAILRGGGERGGADRLTLLIASIFLFGTTRGAFTEGARSIIKGRGLVLNTSFPRALLPLASIYKGLLELMPAGIIYLIIHVIAGRPFGVGLALLPLLIALQTVMNIGIVFLMSTAMVRFPDTGNFVGYGVRLLMFTTPILYSVEALQQYPLVTKILNINPLYHLFAGYHEILRAGAASPLQIFATAAWAAFFLVIGTRTFLRHERSFALHI
jgi:teichoic acid transport system permease protein